MTLSVVMEVGSYTYWSNPDNPVSGWVCGGQPQLPYLEQVGDQWHAYHMASGGHVAYSADTALEAVQNCLDVQLKHLTKLLEGLKPPESLAAPEATSCTFRVLHCCYTLTHVGGLCKPSDPAWPSLHHLGGRWGVLNGDFYPSAAQALKDFWQREAESQQAAWLKLDNQACEIRERAGVCFDYVEKLDMLG